LQCDAGGLRADDAGSEESVSKPLVRNLARKLERKGR